MRYALLIHYPQPPAISLSEETVKQGMAAFQAYAKALDDAGVLRSAEVLQTVANATSVSMKQGKLQVQDGPFADTKEAFAGIFTLDVPDLDATIGVVEGAGGQCVVPKMPVPGVGWLAYFKDTEGHIFGAMQADPSVK